MKQIYLIAFLATLILASLIKLEGKELQKTEVIPFNKKYVKSLLSPDKAKLERSMQGTVFTICTFEYTDIERKLYNITVYTSYDVYCNLYNSIKLSNDSIRFELICTKGMIDSYTLYKIE